jgi:hypothetical protein
MLFITSHQQNINKYINVYGAGHKKDLLLRHYFYSLCHGTFLVTRLHSVDDRVTSE